MGRVENGSQFQDRDGPLLASNFTPLALALIALGAPPHSAPDRPALHTQQPRPAETRPDAATVRLHRETHVMGTRLGATVLAPDRELAAAAIEDVFREVRRLDTVLSSWRADAELARLNHASPGVPVPVSTELYRWLREARAWVEATDRAFDPAIGALIDIWDLRGAGRRPAAEELAAALDRTGLNLFRLPDAPLATGESGLRRTIVRTRAGAWISAGAFGKGVALRAAGSRLNEAGLESALLDFGGQILAMGGDRSGPGWDVAIAHPARRDEPVAWLRLCDRSAATTGTSERYVDVEGERLGHVLDPRTGRPVPAWGSVTVIAEDPVAADVLSTALFVMGPEAGMRWLEARDIPEVGAVFAVDRAGRVELRWTAGAERWRGHPPGRVPAGTREPSIPRSESTERNGKR